MISQKLLRAILFTPADDRGKWGVPALFWGESGVAKTDVIERLGAVFRMPTETLSPGERGEGAFGVTPVPTADCAYMAYPPPDWTKKFTEARRGVVFVDEATCFVAGTSVSLADKSKKPIEDVRVGDRILSYCLQSGRSRGNVCTSTMRRLVRGLVRVNVSDGTTILCTAEHRFWTDEGWREARGLAGLYVRQVSSMRREVAHDHGDTLEESQNFNEDFQTKISQFSDGFVGIDRTPCANVRRGSARTHQDRFEFRGGEETTGKISGGHPRGDVSAAKCGDTEESGNFVHGSNHIRATSEKFDKRTYLCSREISGSIRAWRENRRTMVEDNGGSGTSERKSDQHVGIWARGVYSYQKSRACDIWANSDDFFSRKTNKVRKSIHSIDHRTRPSTHIYGGRTVTCSDSGDIAALEMPGLRVDDEREEDCASRSTDTGTVFGCRGASRVRGGWVYGDEGKVFADASRGHDCDSSIVPVRVDSVDVIDVDAVVYDITVDRDHNFFADSILVHNCAPPAIQPAILGLVQARRIGGAYLGPGVRVLGAANPPEIAAGGWDLAPPVANRFAHFQWDCPTVEEWSEWLFSASDQAVKTESASAEEERVLCAWGTPWATARGYVAGFLRRRPEFMHKRPAVGDPAASRAWPSPRTWSYAARAIASGIVHDLSATDAEAYVRACVGDGAGNEFATWRREADLPDPLDVLDRKVTFKHEPTRLDRTLAILSSCTAIVAPTGADRRSDRAKVLWEILDAVSRDAKDIAVVAAKQLVAAKLQDACKESQTVMGRLWPVIEKTTKL